MNALTGFGLACVLGMLGCDTPPSSPPPPPTDPLPSWQAGPVRDAIVTFVGEATREGSTKFIAPAERIAAFDNDGTLWSEQPMYFQAFFIVDRIKRSPPCIPSGKRGNLMPRCSAAT